MFIPLYPKKHVFGASCHLYYMTGLIMYNFSSVIKKRWTQAIVLRKVCPLYSPHVDRQSSLHSASTFYSRANYPLPRTFLQ